MPRVTVGYQDGALHPLWLSSVGMRVATLLGARAIWLPDHFMGFAPKWMWVPEVVPAARFVHSMDALFDPIPILTLAARRHPLCWVGTSVTDPIRRHPMSLAQSFATLDHVAKGRAILGIGNGIVENTEPYGFPAADRVRRLEEAIRIIRLLWESGGRPVDFDGEFWRLRDAVFDLPLHGGRPPRLFVGAHFPRMLAICGRWADGWLPGQKIGAAEYGERLSRIRAAAAKAGRPMEGFTAAQTLLVCFGKSKQQVVDLALRNAYCAYMALGLPPAVWTECGSEHPLGEDFLGFLDLVPSRTTREQVETAQRRLTPAMLERLFYLGTAEEIFAEAAPLAAAGCNHFILANMGAAFTGRGLADFWEMGKLTRRLKKLEAPALV
jgi:phthiodiolone/phenolphthiodiolone dimycocerosates ketoreductase